VGHICPAGHERVKVSVMAVDIQVHICSSVSRPLLKISNVILIFSPQPDDSFLEFHVRDGKNSTSRFGLSLSTLGDINKDGYGGKYQEIYSVLQRFLV